jgi:hypothetical protein
MRNKIVVKINDALCSSWDGQGTSRHVKYCECDSYSDDLLNSIENFCQVEEPRRVHRMTKGRHRDKGPAITGELFQNGDGNILRMRLCLLRRKKAQDVELGARLVAFFGDDAYDDILVVGSTSGINAGGLDSLELVHLTPAASQLCVQSDQVRMLSFPRRLSIPMD